MTAWNTEITSISTDRILVRGYPVGEVMEKLSFSDTIFLILKGELPSPAESKVFGAVLTSSIDHGVTPPSVLATLNATSTGAPLNAAVASGLLAINDFHGGAIQNAMHVFTEAADHIGRSLETALVREFVDSKLRQRFRFPGFGHRVHKTDPRSTAFTNLCRRELPEEQLFHLTLADMIRTTVRDIKGKDLPLNVDGAIAAVLLSLEFSPELANGIFMISRLPGLIAHYGEEKTTQRPMRRIDQSSATYTGPEERHMPKSKLTGSDQ